MLELEKKDTILEVQNLRKYFPITTGVFSRVAGYVKAVDGVSFSVKRGKTMGIVGESGCGKSTLARVILHLHEKTDGKIFFDGEDISSLSAKNFRKYRRQMQIVFQDPFSTLNPRMTIGQLLEEPLKLHHIGDTTQRKEEVKHLIHLVDLDEYHLPKYPHEFSGGQRQRIGIARAICLNPKLIICDEPVSALDISIQNQIINLLKDLQAKFQLTYLFISHDLSVVEYMCDTVGVMYLGKMLEMGSVEQIFKNPQHPYTQALLSAIPVPDPTAKKEKILLTGDVPNPANIPCGCRFHTRCRYKNDVCTRVEPRLKQIGEQHCVACHLLSDRVIGV